MTKLAAPHRIVHAAVLAAVIALLVGATPAHAASSVQIETRALVGGRYEVSGWMAVSVTLVNEGAPTEGYLSTTTSIGTVRRFVDLPSGARKVVPLYVQPEAFQRELTIAYDEPNGQVSSTVAISVLEQSNDQVAVVGDATGTLRPQLASSTGLDAPEPIILGPADIPERPEPLGGLATIIWAGDSSALTEAQRRSIERWVTDGGRLVVMGGPDWQARTAAFTDLLPMSTLASVDDVSGDPVAEWAGAGDGAVEAETVSSGTLGAEARALITADDGTVLASMRPLGGGRVVLIGGDMATPAYRAWDGAPGFWARILPTDALLEQFWGAGVPRQDEITSAMTGALETLPALEVPPAELLLVVIVGYILLIGPISYLVLRRVDRRELAWVTAPILIVLFSACSYGIGRSLKGSDVVVNQITVTRTTPVGSAATVDTYAGVFSPDRATYDFTVEADALLGRMLTPSDPTASGSVVVEQGEPAHLRDLAINVFDFEGVHASAILEQQQALEVSWVGQDGEVTGTVTNISDATLTDVAYISASGGERIGDLEPGASAEFTVPSTNFNGSAASDQVYGFGGLDSGSDDQRRIALRRQVINALVGQNQLGGVDLGVSGGRGPYVIGWREAEGPMPIIVDGITAQRHVDEVEVLAVRPIVGDGEVTILPHQMGTAILETTGAAALNGPGMVSIGDGSATFGISLPLEAVGLAADEVEIIVGPDPSMVLSDPGQLVGFWPEGMTVEVRDADGGGWTTIGDLGRQNRFTLDDPSALGPTGRIEVRITGVEVDPNFGQQGVFVTAEVSGVIDR